MKQAFFLLTFALFLLSGATGLAYETLWIRVLAWGVGSTSQSMSLVLSIFFLGLSLGSYLSGRFSDRVKNSLFVYGVIETSLGIVAIAILFPLLNLQKLLVLLPLTGSFSWVGLLAKFVLVALLLVVPTALMGATLPLLVRTFTHVYGSVGKSVSRLYAINTFGAVLGAFLTGFLLIPKWGVISSNLLAAFLNILIGLIAIFLSKKNLQLSMASAPVERKALSQEPIRLSLNQKMVLLSTGVCGFISIAAEVMWNKYLNIYFGSNIYGIGLVLAVFLFGIAAGSLVLSLWVDRIQDKTRFYLSLLCVSVVALVFSSLLLNSAPIAALYVQAYTGGILSLLWAKTLVVSLLLLLPTLLFGALFPLAISLLTDAKENAGRIVGIAYSVNTIGAISGSYCAGIWLIPHFGSSITLKIVVILGFCSALSLVYSHLEGRAVRLKSYGVIGVLLLLCVQSSKVDFRNLIKSAYQQTGYSQDLQVQRGAWLESKLKFFEPDYEDFRLIVEGETSVISLSHDPQDGEGAGFFLRLKTSGLNESVYNLQNLEELPKYEALIGLLPYLFSRAPKTAFVVGYGGGFTVDFLTQTDLKRVNVAELEKGILDAANYVYQGKNPITSRSNLNLKVEDARFVLASHLWGNQDIIVSQPSHSWLSGAANLFTEEFFTIVKDNLTERGVFSQWLNLYNMDVPVLKSILKTFYTVFPYGAVFTQAGDHELVLLGSKHPLELNLRKLELVKSNPIFQRKLTQVFEHSTFDLLSMYSLSREEALALTQDSIINTDVNAFAEVRQSRIFYEGLGKSQSPQQYLSSVFTGDFSPIVKNADTPEFYSSLLNSLNLGEQYDKFPQVLSRYEQKVKGDIHAAQSLGYLCLRAHRFQSAKEYLLKAFREKQTVKTFNTLLATLSEKREFAEGARLLKQYPRLRDRLTDCYAGEVFLETGEEAKADSVFARIVKDVGGYTELCGQALNKSVGHYYSRKHNPSVALPFLEAYYKDAPTDIPNLQRMIVSYQENHDPGNERTFKEYLPTAIETERQKTQALITLLRERGLKEDAEVLETRLSHLPQSVLSE